MSHAVQVAAADHYFFNHRPQPERETERQRDRQRQPETRLGEPPDDRPPYRAGGSVLEDMVESTVACEATRSMAAERHGRASTVVLQVWSDATDARFVVARTTEEGEGVCAAGAEPPLALSSSLSLSPSLSLSRSLELSLSLPGSLWLSYPARLWSLLQATWLTV